LDSMDFLDIVMELRKQHGIDVILNNSFGMLGINSVLILKKYLG